MVDKERIHEQIDTFNIQELEALREWKAQGKHVAALFNRYFPPALLHGLGLWPLRITQGATQEAESNGERLVRPDSCPFCKSILGNFLAGKQLHSYADVVIGAIACDQMRRTLERISADINIPMFPVQIPATRTIETTKYYCNGILNLLKNLEHHFDRSLDYSAVYEFEQQRKVAGKLLSDALWSLKIPPTIFHRLAHLFSWTRPENFSPFLRDLLLEINPYKPRFSVLVIGSMVCAEDDTMVKILEKEQIGYLPLHSTGSGAIENIDSSVLYPDASIVETIARHYLLNLPASIRSRPNDSVYKMITDIIQRTGARGVILKTLTFCDLWYTEKERLKRSLPVPVLVFDSGYGKGGEMRIETRLDAFLETLL